MGDAMRKILALVLMLLAEQALAQGTFPLNNIPIGKGPGKTGWTALAPGANGTCLVIAGGAPSFGSCGSLSPGGSDQQIQYNNAGAFGGLTNTQVTTRINAFTSVLSGAVPASGGGTTNFLRADGSFAAPPGGVGDVVGSGTPVVGDLAAYTSTTGKAIASPGYKASQVPGLIPTTSTVTISNGANASVTWAAHGLTGGETVFFCTTGGLPTGLTACSPASGTTSANTYASNPTVYYVCYGATLGTNNFAVATTLANAKAGVCVTTSSAGSGTHTAFANAMACAGCVGEYIYSSVPFASPVALTSGSAGQVWVTMSLSPGIWEIGGNAGVLGAAGTVFQHMHAGLVYGFTTIPTSPYNGVVAAHITSNSSNGWAFAYDPEQIFLATTTTINGVMTADFTVSTAGAYGKIWARRIK